MPSIGGARQSLVGRIAADAYSGLSFDNASDTPWTIAATVDLTRNAATVEQLFRNFTLCIAHTHPPGDYREYPAYYTKVHAGPRFLMFDGAGSCLLLGAMIQALASRILNEKIDLHYSVATGRRLTHVFASWKNQFFVDPDQKTWLPLDKVDDAAVYGYIFQQLGVSANALYSELGRGRARQPVLEHEPSLFRLLCSFGPAIYERAQAKHRRAVRHVQAGAHGLAGALLHRQFGLFLEGRDAPPRKPV